MHNHRIRSYPYFWAKLTMRLCTFFFLAASMLSSCSDEALRKTLETVNRSLEDEPALSSAEVTAGLKEALRVGITNAAEASSAKDGFYKNPRLFIPFPEEAQKVKSAALNLGMRSQVEKFEETMNRAAEEAVKEAVPIFTNAITSMTVEDAFGLLRSDNKEAATAYLRSRTEEELIRRFRPRVDDAVEQVELTAYWNPLASAYNTAAAFTGGQAVNPDLTGYVTDHAMDGLFLLVAEEEAKIRENPSARVNDILRRVFGSQEGR